MYRGGGGGGGGEGGGNPSPSFHLTSGCLHLRNTLLVCSRRDTCISRSVAYLQHMSSLSDEFSIVPTFWSAPRTHSTQSSWSVPSSFWHGTHFGRCSMLAC